MQFVLADSTGNSQSLAGALGLSWWSLAVNALAFLIVAWVLGRYVYPALLKFLEAKADDYAAAGRLKQAAEQALRQTETETQKLINEARQSAEQIIGDARDQANQLLEKAEARAAGEAKRIVAQGREQLQHDIAAARQELKSDTARLVAEASRAVLGRALDRELDSALVGRSLEEVEV